MTKERLRLQNLSMNSVLTNSEEKDYCSYYLKEKFGCYETIIIIIIIGQLVHNFDPDFNLTETVGWIANFVSFMGE